MWLKIKESFYSSFFFLLFSLFNKLDRVRKIICNNCYSFLFCFVLFYSNFFNSLNNKFQEKKLINKTKQKIQTITSSCCSALHHSTCGGGSCSRFFIFLH